MSVNDFVSHLCKLSLSWGLMGAMLKFVNQRVIFPLALYERKSLEH